MYGKHFADTDTSNVVMEMLRNVIVTHEIGGFTAETLPEFLKGKHMEMITFTKFVLRKVGMFTFFNPCT